MNKQAELQELENKANLLRGEIANEKRDHIYLFRKNIDTLICNTPTGQLRNDICDLNILFELIIG